jgi:hypothetical protein
MLAVSSPATIVTAQAGGELAHCVQRRGQGSAGSGGAIRLVDCTEGHDTTSVWRCSLSARGLLSGSTMLIVCHGSVESIHAVPAK